MTASGMPEGEDDGLRQEGIWEERSSDEAPKPRSADDGLARRLTSTSHTPGPAGLLYADVPNRIIALVLDIIVLSLVGFVLAWLLGGLVSRPGAIDAAGGELDIVAFLIVLILQLAFSFGYFAGCWSQLARTPGMHVLGVRIGGEADGRPIGWRHAAIRWLVLGLPALLASLAVYVPNAIGLILGALGVVWMLALLYTTAQSPAKQGLHDRLAHTIVVRARHRAS